MKTLVVGRTIAFFDVVGVVFRFACGFFALLGNIFLINFATSHFVSADRRATARTTTR